MKVISSVISFIVSFIAFYFLVFAFWASGIPFLIDETTSTIGDISDLGKLLTVALTLGIFVGCFHLFNWFLKRLAEIVKRSKP